MLAEMYKRREKFGYLFLAATVLVIVGWLIFQTLETEREWWEMLFFLFPIGLVFSVISISRSHYDKVKDILIPASLKNILDLQEVVIKKDMTFMPSLLLFEKSGEFVGRVEPVEVAWWMRPLIAVHPVFITLFPLNCSFITHEGKRQLTFRKKGWLKQVHVTIFDEAHKKIGTYIQEELKALIHIKGELFDDQGESLLAVKASGFSGNFSWSDEQDRQWAYFYNGMFPHEYTELFRDSHNHIVKLSDRITEEDKKRLLAVIGYLFMMRINN